jgi:hypothetical protein
MMIDELERLAKLWKDGVLTDEEFAAQKQRIFAAQADAPSLPVSPVADPAEALMSDPPTPEAALEETVSPSEDDLGFDDLDALLGDALLDTAPTDEPAEAEALPSPTDPPPADDGEPSAGDDFQFDDLDALLEAEPPLADDMANAEAVSSPIEGDPPVDDLAALLADAGLDFLPPDAVPASNVMPLEPEPLQPDDTAPDASDDLGIDDPVAMPEPDALVAQASDEPPQVEKASAEGLPLPNAAAQPAENDPQSDDPSAEPGAAPGAKLPDPTELETPAPPADATVEEGASAAAPAPGAQTQAPVARRKLDVIKAITARLAGLRRLPLPNLPQPVLLGIGAFAIFATMMGLGIALAFAVGSEPESTENAAADDHGHAEAADDSAETAPEEPEPAENMAAPQLSEGAEDVLRQCPSLSAMTELFGTTLAANRNVPVQSLRLIAGSGHVRADAHAPDGKACLVEIDTQNGPLQCKVEAVVRYSDGVVGAHLDAGRRAVSCEGDAQGERSHGLDRTAQAGG